MNYRHVYHAGNFADVLKHVTLARVITLLQRKDAPFRVIDTHAGTGCYDLGGPQATKTLEWRDGAGRLFADAEAGAIAPDVKALLSPWFAAIAAENPAGGLAHYPGSPRIARHLLRRQDRLVAIEAHPEDGAALADLFRGDQNVKVHVMDGWVAIKSFLPPKERRGLVLIDPPYEEAGEFARLTAALKEGLARFETGVFMVWYPVKALQPVRAFHADVAALCDRPVLRVEQSIYPGGNPERLNGHGLLVINPPWQLDEELGVVMPYLARRLARHGDGAGVVEWVGKRM